MAKKKTALKLAKKKPVAAKKAKAKKAAPKKAKPKAQKLPGMDTPKVRALDAVCEKLAEVRESKNAAAKKEKELVGTALYQLKTHSLHGYTAHGVELYRVQGDEKVRVRLVDDDNTGESEPDGADEPMGGMDARARGDEEAPAKEGATLES